MSNTKPPDPDVVEIDALDEAEWEQGQHTPIAPDKKLEALVRQTAPTPPVAAPLVDPSHGAKSVTYVRTTMRAATIATPAPEPPAPRPTPMPMRAAGEPATPSTSRPVDAPGATAASTAAKLRSVLAKPKPPAVAPALATKKPVTPLPSRVSTSADTFVSADYVDADETQVGDASGPVVVVREPAKPVPSTARSTRLPLPSRPAPARSAAPIPRPPVLPSVTHAASGGGVVVEPAPVADSAGIEPLPAPPMLPSALPVFAERPGASGFGSGSAPLPTDPAKGIDVSVPAAGASREHAARAASLTDTEPAHSSVGATDERFAAKPARKRRIGPLLAGGVGVAIAGLVLAIVALRAGGDAERTSSDRLEGKRVVTTPDERKSPDAAAPPSDEDAPIAVTDPPSVERSPRTTSGSTTPPRDPDPARDVTAAARDGVVTATVPANEIATTVAPPVTPPKRRPPTFGGKKVVLEYDTAPKADAKKPAEDDTASVGAARITYFSGNRKLFAGDADGAIQLYRQALAVYPGYVAGYRGLGLAYAQKGDKANALKAFRTYVSAVPSAKDIALVKKRIAILQR